MSCFICDDKTISVIARAFVEYGVEFKGLPPKSTFDMIIIDLNKETKKIGQALLDQNYKSFNYRYGEENEVPEFKLKEVEFNEGTVLGCIACYEYQACETNDWYKDNYVKDNLIRLKEKILIRFCKALNMKMPYGYDGFDMMEG